MNQKYIDAVSGKELWQKPEEMTHLRGNLLIPKNSPRIAFRGQLDSLSAMVLEIQVMASKENSLQIVNDLQELLSFIRMILAAEVKESPMKEIHLLGMDSSRIRYVSHHLNEEFGIDHQMPHYQMGELCIALNRLRTEVRKTELLAAQAFFNSSGICERKDIIEGLNRLSSCVYIMFCKVLTGKYNRKGVSAMNQGIEKEIQEIVAKVIAGVEQQICQDEIPVEISARHVHLTQEAVEILFGKGYELTKVRDLSQPGEFLSKERVKIVTQKGEISSVAVLGPVRPQVQVEISKTDSRTLGVDVPLCLSGDLEGGADMLLLGPVGILEAKECTIVAQAHVHMTPEDSAHYGVNDGEVVSVQLKTQRPLTLNGVIVRVKPASKLAVHIDFDEANAAFVDASTKGVIVKRSCMPTVQTAQKQPEEKAPAAVCSFKKKLIAESDAVKMIKDGCSQIQIPKGCIVTPAARDVFSNARVTIIS